MSDRSPPRMRAECSCGVLAEGIESEVVAAMIEHARSVHGRTLTPDQVVLMLHPT